MKVTSSKFLISILLALATGILLGKLDTLPHWDDTGITAFLVLITTFIFGWLLHTRGWLWAMIIGGCIVAFNIFPGKNYGVLIVFLFAFAGSYAGLLLRRFIGKSHS